MSFNLLPIQKIKMVYQKKKNSRLGLVFGNGHYELV